MQSMGKPSCIQAGNISALFLAITHESTLLYDGGQLHFCVFFREFHNTHFTHEYYVHIHPEG